jgi:hypothetical protein
MLYLVAAHESEDEPIDENDPLWKAVLEITGGDREKAVIMLEDPDELMKYPNVKAIMEGSSKEDDWESDANLKEVADNGLTLSTTSAAETGGDQSADLPTPSKQSVQSSANVDPEDIVVEEEIVEESDPRPHLNLVFIGHVDAGKVSMSRSHCLDHSSY